MQFKRVFSRAKLESSPLSVRASKEMQEALKILADYHGMTMGEFVVATIDEFLQKEINEGRLIYPPQKNAETA